MNTNTQDVTAGMKSQPKAIKSSQRIAAGDLATGTLAVETLQDKAVEARLRALLGRRPGPAVGKLPQKSARQRAVRLSLIAAAIAAVNADRISLEDAEAAQFGPAATHGAQAGRIIRRGARLLLVLVIRGIEARLSDEDRPLNEAQSSNEREKI